MTAPASCESPDIGVFLQAGVVWVSRSARQAVAGVVWVSRSAQQGVAGVVWVSCDARQAVAGVVWVSCGAREGGWLRGAEFPSVCGVVPVWCLVALFFF